MNDIFKRFQIEPDAPDKVVVIGFDNGAGNCCASVAIDTERGPQFKPLYFDKNGVVRNEYTVLAIDKGTISDKSAPDIAGRNALGLIGGCNADVFVNFKRPPDTDYARETYGNDFNAPAPTYEDLMQRFFKSILENMMTLQCNKDVFDEELTRAVIFVGRPASEIWKKKEVAYQKLLKKGLKIKGFKDGVDLIVYSEAQAALAYEYEKGNIKPGEIVLIVDCGSSTFDAVLVQAKRILAEYSCQLGAGEIEQLMMDVILSGEDAASLKSVDTRIQMRKEQSRKLEGTGSWAFHVSELRGIKENFFGPDGKDNKDQTYKVQMDGKSCRIIFDDDMMHRITHGIPIRVEFADGDDYRPLAEDYNSFAGAAREFLKKTYALCESKGINPKEKKVRVILTGGASVMPFISEQVTAVYGKNAFGKGNSQTDDPAYSVGQGLAFMGYIELKKYSVLKTAKAALWKKLDEKKDEFLDTICDTYAGHFWERMVSEVREWAKKYLDEDRRTLRQVVKGETKINMNKAAAALSDKDSGLQSICKEVIDEVNKAMAQAMGDQTVIQKKFCYQVNKSVMYRIHDRTSGLQEVSFYFYLLIGNWRTFWDYADKPLNRDQRQYVLKRIQGNKWDIYNNLKRQLISNSWDAKDLIVQLLLDDIYVKLEEYMEDITPNIIEEYT